MDDNSFGWVRPYLNQDEIILWRGKPAGGHLFGKSDILMIPFSLMWGGFVLFWEASVLTANAPLLFKLWGIPFVLVGLYMIAGRFLYKSWQRKRTEYVVTNQRIFRCCGKRVDMLHKCALPPMQTVLNSDGTGSIFFSTGTAEMRKRISWSGSQPTSWPGMVGMFVIDTVPDVNRVLRAIASEEQN